MFIVSLISEVDASRSPQIIDASSSVLPRLYVAFLHNVIYDRPIPTLPLMAQHRKQQPFVVLVAVCVYALERSPRRQGVKDGAETFQRPFLANVQRQYPFALSRDIGIGKVVCEEVCLKVGMRVDGPRWDTGEEGDGWKMEGFRRN
jgi:hypothetical protein